MCILGGSWNNDKVLEATTSRRNASAAVPVCNVTDSGNYLAFSIRVPSLFKDFV